MKDVIDLAIAFEKEGAALYEKLAQSAENKLARRLFESLGKQEQDHIQYIQSYAKSKKFTPMEYTPLEEQIKEVYQGLEISTEEKSMSDLEGYQVALALENKGYTLYADAFAGTGNVQDRKFFEFLMNMEREHYEALANVYYYMTNNAQWLAENESETWSWMNT